MGILKTSAAIAGAYIIGGKLGAFATQAIYPSASPPVQDGIAWGARFATFAVIYIIIR